MQVPLRITIILILDGPAKVIKFMKNTLFYRDVTSYRYEVDKDTYIPIVSNTLKNALSSLEHPVIHPYYVIDKDTVYAKAEYAWDGATGVLRQTKNIRIPSLIHDIGCQAINNGQLPRSVRKAFDKEYYEQCRLYGVCSLRRLLHYVGIRLWGLISKTKEVESYAKIHGIVIRQP